MREGKVTVIKPTENMIQNPKLNIYRDSLLFCKVISLDKIEQYSYYLIQHKIFGSIIRKIVSIERDCLITFNTCNNLCSECFKVEEIISIAKLNMIFRPYN